MKLIFLDFDGVLNSDAWRRSEHYNRDHMDDRAVERLVTIIEKTGAFVVISSNWRWINTFPVLQHVLIRHGVPSGAVIGATPRLEGETRGKEIELYIETIPFKFEGIDSFVILDDVEEMGDLEHRLVRTTSESGLQDEHIEEALKILEEPWEPEIELT